MQGQACLAYAGRASEGEQARIAAKQQATYFFHFLLTPDQWCKGSGQVSADRGERPGYGTLAPGKADEPRTLVWRDAQRLGQQLGYLPGGAAHAQLELSDGRFGAADTLRQVFLPEVKRFSPLP